MAGGTAGNTVQPAVGYLPAVLLTYVGRHTKYMLCSWHGRWDLLTTRGIADTGGTACYVVGCRAASRGLQRTWRRGGAGDSAAV